MQKKIKMRVFGMTCEDCALTVTKGLKGKDGVLDAKVSLRAGIAEVLVDADKVRPEELETLPVFSGKSPYRAKIREDRSEGRVRPGNNRMGGCGVLCRNQSL
ncbi:MAG: heavy-metal-associated domain-containing protein [Thermoprotei archaeon]